MLPHVPSPACDAPTTSVTRQFPPFESPERAWPKKSGEAGWQTPASDQVHRAYTTTHPTERRLFCKTKFIRASENTIINSKQRQILSKSNWIQPRHGTSLLEEYCIMLLVRLCHSLCGSYKLLYYKRYVLSMGRGDFWTPTAPKLEYG